MTAVAENRPRSRTILVVTALCLAAFGYGVFLLFAPDRFPMNFARGPVARPAPDLIVGPYPVEAELLRLKRMGVVEVLSLLDAVSPVEGELVVRERNLVERLGMRFVNIPVPVGALLAGDGGWETRTAGHIRANPVSLRYLHCYLGRHRVKRVLTALNLPGNSAG